MRLSHHRGLGTAALLLSCFVAALAEARADEGSGRESVVKVFATMRLPDPYHPWVKQSPSEGSGTGVVIEGKRILTNAHVVSYASQVFVQPHQASGRLPATVEYVSTGIDLAVLKLADESFFDKHPPLPRAEALPEAKEAVMVYGYPTGGASLSVTKGIVSRIEFTGYNGTTSGLRIQIDAAINPGNSGGPALVDGKMIGLTFSKLGGADNIGYIIPSEEVDLFLKDVADGKYDGKPAMFDMLQTLENEALRAKLGVPKEVSGIVVHEPERRVEGEPANPLKPWDLLTKIGDYAIDDTGMVTVRDGLQLKFQYLIQKLAANGKVHLTVIRDGVETGVDAPVSPKREMLISDLRGRYPSYFVFGPLVFSAATNEFLSSFDRLGERIYPTLAYVGNPLVTRRGDRPRFEGEELVVVSSKMFPHKLSAGYSDPFAKVVKDVNGTPIKNLRHMAETLRDCADRFAVISFDDRASETIVLDREGALAATEDILTENGIRRRSSEDLAPIWDKK